MLKKIVFKSKYWKIILSVIIVGVPLYIVYFHEEISKGDMLSFLGAIFGSCIAISGVYYQVEKDISNERELQFSLARPYIVFRTAEDQNLSSKIFLSNVVDPALRLEKEFFNDIPKLSLKNLSNNLLMSVKIVISYTRGKNIDKEFIMVDRINENTEILFILGSKIINDFNSDLYRFVSEVSKISNNRKEEIEKVKNIYEELYSKYTLDDENLTKMVKDITSKNIVDEEKVTSLLQYLNDMRVNFLAKEYTDIYSNIRSIGIYFTTSVREKIYLEFERKKVNGRGIFEYNKDKTIIENKDGKFSDKSYNTAKIIESPLL